MRYRFAVAAFVLAGVLAGCGGDDRPDQRIAAARTGRFEMTIVANGPSRAVSLRATGSFDDERHLFSLVTDYSELMPGLEGPLAIIATPDAVFVDCPYLARLLGASTRWISVRGSSNELFGSSVIDPVQFLDAVRTGGLVPEKDLSIDVGDDGLVRRIVMRFDAAGKEGGALVTLEYFDFGAPVVIEPPAADQVTDETDAVNRLFGGTTGG